MLEPLRVESFSLKVEDSGVAVYTQKREDAPPAAPNISLRVTWQMFRRKKTEGTEDPQPSSGALEIHYTHEDIARMESEGQSKRQDLPGSPEAHALSQILRAVGAFVDHKQGRLLAITKEGQDITIEYESALNRALTEKFTIASLYDYWVSMYLRRRQRS